MAIIVFAPPLVGRDEVGKAMRTLERCVISGDPIEDERDQCSVACWSRQRGELSLYRDWRGGPILYHARVGSTLLWSTSLLELLSFGVPGEPDRVALAQLQLVGYVPAPRTMVERIGKVPAGHVLAYRDGRAETTRRWRPEFAPKHRDDTKRRAAVLTRILQTSITSMGSSSGPTGVLLSGGIDSTTVLAVAARHTDLDLRAFTFRYEGYTGEFNESPAARATASALGVEHDEISIGPSFVMDNLPRLLTAYEAPMTYGIHSARLGPLKAMGCDVALSGVDLPLFNLSPPFRWAMRARRLMPQGMAALGAQLTRSAHRGPLRKANTLITLAAADSEHRYLRYPLHVAVPETVAPSLYTDPDLFEDARVDLEDGLSRTLRAVEGLTPRDQLILLGMTGSGPEHVLAWNYRWGAAADVSVRFPLCDPAFVHYMSRRHGGSSAKKDLRAVAAEALPPEIVDSPKIPQTIPLGVWFRGPMKDYLREHLSEARLADEGTFRPDVVTRCLDEHLQGHANHKWALWTCLTYLVWRDRVLESA